MVYNIQFINSISSEILSNNKLPENVKNVIKNLSDKVLSPNYSRTPVFKKKYNNNFVNYNKFVQHTSTKIIQNKNIINDVKCYLNKLSVKTLTEISENIIKELQNSSNEDKKKIVNILFDMKTSSLTFVKLYKDLIKNIIIKQASILPIIFETVNEINSNIVNEIKSVENYDDLCKNNEILENKSSQYILIALLSSDFVIDKTFIFTLLNNLEKNVRNNVENSESKNLNEYYTKNICKILNILNENSTFEDDLNDHNKFLLDILTMTSNKSKNKGLSNKTGFNIMDYCDENGLEY